MNERKPKAAITVSEMCELLEMSRSQVYLHIKRGTFHEPLRLANGRPYFNASQVEDNLKAKELGIGVNGEYVPSTLALMNHLILTRLVSPSVTALS